jgi:hypothetical protein
MKIKPQLENASYVDGTLKLTVTVAETEGAPQLAATVPLCLLSDDQKDAFCVGKSKGVTMSVRLGEPDTHGNQMEISTLVMVCDCQSVKAISISVNPKDLYCPENGKPLARLLLEEFLRGCGYQLDEELRCITPVGNDGNDVQLGFYCCYPKNEDEACSCRISPMETLAVVFEENETHGDEE